MGWEITRAAVPKVEWITRKAKVTHRYKIKGYYGLKDAEASEIAFNAIVDAIILKLISKKVPGSQGHSLPTVSTIEARAFGSILCHYAEIEIDVSEVIEAISDEVLGDLLRIELNYYLKPGDDIEDAVDLVELKP